MRNSIALIGMPGAGKSAVGRELALKLNKRFVDTDELVEAFTKKSLQDIADQLGYRKLRAIEQQVILDSRFDNAVIATGGSAVYADQGMAHLKTCAQLVYLQASLATLSARVDNWDTRGLASPPGQSLQSLFDERVPLYLRYAEQIVDVDGCTVNAVVVNIITMYSEV